MLVTFEIKEAPMGERATGWAKEIQEAFAGNLEVHPGTRETEPKEWGPDAKEREVAFLIPNIGEVLEDPDLRDIYTKQAGYALAECVNDDLKALLESGPSPRSVGLKLGKLQIPAEPIPDLENGGHIMLIRLKHECVLLEGGEDGSD